MSDDYENELSRVIFGLKTARVCVIAVANEKTPLADKMCPGALDALDTVLDAYARALEKAKTEAVVGEN